MTTTYQVIFWRDIPAQVKVRAGSKRVGRPLSQRFQVAIDEAAMRAGKARSEDYMTEWRMSSWQERDGDPDTLAEELVTELENSYPAERLRLLVRLGGFEESPQRQE
jgi:hypothetical protein